jgi:hypothetical protein
MEAQMRWVGFVAVCIGVALVIGFGTVAISPGMLFNLF